MANQAARNARDQGIATAIQHAERINPEWPELAYNALVEYAKTRETFTIEQLRVHLGATLAEPPSRRAWGPIAQKAQKAGILEHHGWQEADNPDCHCGEVRVWRSTTYEPRGFYVPMRDLSDAEIETLSKAVYGPIMAMPSINQADVDELANAARFARLTAAGPLGYTDGADRRLERALLPFGGAK